MNKQTPANQKGFTLVELIVVIVILGILAATAVPKFVDLGGDAREAAIKSVEGAMRTANANVYAKAALNGTLGNSTTPGTTVVNGANVTTEYGFANSVAELVKAMDIDAASFDSTTAVTEIRHVSATTPASCKVAYAKATATTAPTYTATLTGC